MMTTCSECLQTMATSRISEIRPGTPIAVHCSICGNCATVLREVAFAEQQLANSMADLRPQDSVEELTRAALVGSERMRRKRIGRWVRGGLAVAACAVLFGAFMAFRTVNDSEPEGITMDTMRLTCLTAQQAAELATPYLRSSGSAIYRADDLGTITIRGQRKEFLAARAAIERFDAPDQCTLPPPSPAPSATTPVDR